jgi:hypothetical protein
MRNLGIWDRAEGEDEMMTQPKEDLQTLRRSALLRKRVEKMSPAEFQAWEQGVLNEMKGLLSWDDLK